jgi:hypothetical protein
VIKLAVTCAGRWFSPVSSTNKNDSHDIAEILLTVALNTITKPTSHLKNGINPVLTAYLDKLLSQN